MTGLQAAADAGARASWVSVRCRPSASRVKPRGLACPTASQPPPFLPPRAGFVDLAHVAVVGGSHGGFLTGHLMGQHGVRMVAAGRRRGQRCSLLLRAAACSAMQAVAAALAKVLRLLCVCCSAGSNNETLPLHAAGALQVRRAAQPRVRHFPDDPRCGSPCFLFFPLVGWQPGERPPACPDALLMLGPTRAPTSALGLRRCPAHRPAAPLPCMHPLPCAPPLLQ